MGKAFKDFTVDGVMRLDGYWITDKEQKDALKYIFQTMIAFDVAPTEHKLLEHFSTGDGNNIITDRADINKVIGGMCNVPISVDNSDQCKKAMRALGKSSVARKMSAYEVARDKYSEYATYLQERAEKLAKAKLQLLNIDTLLSETQIMTAQEVTTWRLLETEQDGQYTVMRFLQAVPTVLTYVDTRAMTNISHDFGRLMCEMKVSATRVESLKVIGGYNIANSRGYIHPNVSRSWAICFGAGNAKADTAKSKLDIVKLLTLLDNMLRTYSAEGPFHSVSEFILDHQRISTLTEAQCKIAGLEFVETNKCPYEPIDCTTRFYKIKPEFVDAYDGVGPLFESRRRIYDLLIDSKTSKKVLEHHCDIAENVVKSGDIKGLATDGGRIFYNGKLLAPLCSMIPSNETVELQDVTPYEHPTDVPYAIALSDEKKLIGVVTIKDGSPTKFFGMNDDELFVAGEMPSDIKLVAPIAMAEGEEHDEYFAYNESKDSFMYIFDGKPALIIDHDDVIEVGEDDEYDTEGYDKIVKVGEL